MEAGQALHPARHFTPSYCNNPRQVTSSRDLGGILEIGGMKGKLPSHIALYVFAFTTRLDQMRSPEVALLVVVQLDLKRL